MKMKTLFWGGLILMVGLMAWVEFSLPKQFSWKPTFSRYDKEPFGCLVFDDMLSRSLPQGYRVTNETLYLLSQDELSPRNIISVSERLSLTETDFEALMELLEAGDHVLLAASRISGVLEDTFNLSASYSYQNYETLAQHVIRNHRRDTLCWTGPFPGQDFDFYSAFREGTFSEYDSLFTPVIVPLYAISDTADHDAYVLRAHIGQGQLILVSLPLLFTNYGMLDRDNSTQIFRLLSLMGDRPFVRTQAYTMEARENQTPLRYFLSHPPLRWALYMTMLVLVLFAIFTARRRQRVIPVMHPPQNRSMEFTELIGTLYFRRRDHAGLVRKKYIFFAETLRRMIQVDVEDEAQQAQSVERIAGKTGLEKEKIAPLLEGLRHIAAHDVRLTDEEMKQYIDEMNQIINQLYI